MKKLEVIFLSFSLFFFFFSILFFIPIIPIIIIIIIVTTIDLLSKDPKNKLDIKENIDSGAYVKDLTSFVVKNATGI